MNTADTPAATWEVRPEFDGPGATEQSANTMNWALKLQPGVETAQAGLIDRGIGMSLTATMLVTAESAGAALDIAVAAFEHAALDADVRLGGLREIVVAPADFDPRD
ncbi:hypothetical protein AB0M47_16090 [Hamadaea sp. NPDC051192]|uniref:hypothetical protein n=1 Tax=Hamadaea sp. NPDC051192 TaxID=3154940 RepID=UPI00343D03C3